MKITELQKWRGLILLFLVTGLSFAGVLINYSLNLEVGIKGVPCYDGIGNEFKDQVCEKTITEQDKSRGIILGLTVGGVVILTSFLLNKKLNKEVKK